MLIYAKVSKFRRFIQQKKAYVLHTPKFIRLDLILFTAAIGQEITTNSDDMVALNRHLDICTTMDKFVVLIKNIHSHLIILVALVNFLLINLIQEHCQAKTSGEQLALKRRCKAILVVV